MTGHGARIENSSLAMNDRKKWRGIGTLTQTHRMSHTGNGGPLKKIFFLLLSIVCLLDTARAATFTPPYFPVAADANSAQGVNGRISVVFPGESEEMCGMGFLVDGSVGQYADETGLGFQIDCSTYKPWRFTAMDAGASFSLSYLKSHSDKLTMRDNQEAYGIKVSIIPGLFHRLSFDVGLYERSRHSGLMGLVGVGYGI